MSVRRPGLDAASPPESSRVEVEDRDAVLGVERPGRPTRGEKSG